MSKKFFISAVAAGIMAFGVNAMAADANDAPGYGTQIVMRSTPNPAQLELHFSDAQRIMFYDATTLQITRADGTSWKYRPHLSQDVNGKRTYLTPSFKIMGRDRVGLTVVKKDAEAPVLLNGRSPNS